MRAALLAVQLFTATIGVRLASAVSLRATTPAAPYNTTCNSIAAVISTSSAVYYPGSAEYVADMHHWLPTSTQNATCSVEPGTVADVQAIMKVLGATTTPFGIKSGGHSFNVGFSSTLGVQIALTRLNGVTYDKTSNTVTLGMGGIWTDVYTVLEAQGITVSGGRIEGVGVGGYLLGGGYSYLTDNSGLSMDNVVSFQVVLPNATLATASATVHSDLFWGLKGGFNNFGIVTSAVVKAYPLGQVYGGQLVYSGASLALLPAAIASFAAMQNSSNAVPEGGMTIAYSAVPGSDPSAIVQVFYDGTTPPPRLLSAFTGIANDSSSLGLYSYTGLIAVFSPIFANPQNLRAASTTASVYQITADIVTQFWKIIDNLVATFPDADSAAVVFEPFIPSAVVRPLSDGAFAHSVYASPLNTVLWWTDPSQDAAGLKAIDATANSFEALLTSSGQPTSSMMLYPNYADADHPVSALYGPNLPQAVALRESIDPAGVMLRAGGWKFV